MITINTSDFKPIYELLAGIPGAAETSIQRGINVGVAKGKTALYKSIAHQYPSLTKKGGTRDLIKSYLKTKKAALKRLRGEIRTSGKLIPLVDFSITPDQPGTRDPLTALLMGSSVQFPGAFVAVVRKSKYKGVFVRTGKIRIVTTKTGGTRKINALAQVRSLSLAEIINTPELIKPFLMQVMRFVQIEVDRQADLFLRGEIKVSANALDVLNL